MLVVGASQKRSLILYKLLRQRTEPESHRLPQSTSDMWGGAMWRRVVAGGVLCGMTWSSTVFDVKGLTHFACSVCVGLHYCIPRDSLSLCMMDLVA